MSLSGKGDQLNRLHLQVTWYALPEPTMIDSSSKEKVRRGDIVAIDKTTGKVDAIFANVGELSTPFKQKPRKTNYLL